MAGGARFPDAPVVMGDDDLGGKSTWQRRTDRTMHASGRCDFDSAIAHRRVTDAMASASASQTAAARSGLQLQPTETARAVGETVGKKEKKRSLGQFFHRMGRQPISHWSEEKLWFRTPSFFLLGWFLAPRGMSSRPDLVGLLALTACTASLGS